MKLLTDSQEFMLKEYDLLKDFRELIVHQVDNRVNLYLKMFSTVIASIPVLSIFVENPQNVVNNKLLSTILIIVSMLLLYFGVLSFYRVIEGHISIINYTRAINRIRRYFLDNDQNIKKYLAMPVTDNVPKYGTYGFSSVKTINVGATSLIMTLNALNLLLTEALLVWYLSLKVSITPILIIILIIIAIFIAFFYLSLLRYLYNRRMKKAKTKFVPNFII